MAATAAVMTNTAIMAEASVQPASEKSKQIKTRKGLRPNYNYIHRNLLPVEVYPLPTLIPHNPLSLIAIALSYLTRVIAPPQRSIYKGYFSSTTSSIHCTDQETIKALWSMGFFGRGSLSRSEPTWQETQKRKGFTAEENTGQRRTERRQQKLERARKEQEDIAQQLSRERQSGNDATVHTSNSNTAMTSTEFTDGNALMSNESDMSSTFSSLDHVLDNTSKGGDSNDLWKTAVGVNGVPTPPPSTVSDGDLERPVKRLQRAKTVRFSPTIEAREFDLSSPTISPIKSPGVTTATQPAEQPTPLSTSISISELESETEQKEHLNLSLEEAFFLCYSLGVLQVYCEDSDTVLSSTSLLSLFRRHSYHPTRSLSVAHEPDDPFMLSYAVYHHYRSLGWVVRSGVKFSVDFLLYNRGPAFTHADFAIVVLPAYSHAYWSETPDRKKYVMTKTRKSWDWLHRVNRVQAQVHKSLVLCYVEVPPSPTKAEKGQDDDIGKELSRYTVRDVSVRRWTPNRTRD